MEINENTIQFVYWLKKQCEYELAEGLTIPPEIKKIAKKMTSKGYELYVVGGQVRDYLRGNEKLKETIAWCDSTLEEWKKKHPDWKPKEIQMPT